MVKVPLKGVAKATARGKTYWYAWRGGPRLMGEPGSPEFMASYHEAYANLRAPDTSRFHALVIAYRTSPGHQQLAPSTRENWSAWLNRIDDHFGELSIAQFDRPEKIRPIIRTWRNTWAHQPRTADYSMQVLSAVLSHAVERGSLAGNPCHGIKRLYSGSSRADIVWSEADIARFKTVASPEIGHAVDLASHTGLRLGDLVRLLWSHVGASAIILATNKSRGRREAVIPLYGALRQVLANIPKRAVTVLTNSNSQPWTADSLSAAFIRARDKDAAVGHLHFHDLRGTAATFFYTAGLSDRVIAEIMGWEESHVSQIIRRYVDRTAATKAIIAQLDKTRRSEQQ
jgi:integrase